MNTYNLFRVLPFLLIFNMGESNKTGGEFLQHNLANLSSVGSKLNANITKSSKYMFNPNVTNFSNILDRGQNQNSKNLTVLFSFFLVAVLSVLINLRVFYTVFITSKRRSRPANILVAHISSVVIVFTFVFYIYVLEKTNVLSLTAPEICNVLAFLRNNIYHVFPINAVAIIWVRTRSDAIILRKSFAYRSIGVMWVIAILGNSPSTFMVEYAKSPNNKHDKCKEVLLLGSFEATIVYESLRFILFNVMVCVYLIHATIKMRSSFWYLRGLKNERLRKRIQQVRFVYLHTIVFILIWFPNGLGLFLYKIFSRLGWTTDYVKFLTPFVFLNYSAFVLCPLSYVFLLEDMSLTTFVAPCLPENLTNYPVNTDNNEQPEPTIFGWRVDPILKAQKNASVKGNCGTGSDKVEDQKEENSNRFEAIEMSGMTTVGLTGTSASLYFSAPQTQSIQQPIQMESFARPAVLTPTTSAKIKSVQVQLHVEPERKQSKENEEESSEHKRTK